MARELGYPHPDAWLKTVTSKQITEWKAYFYVTSGEYDKNRVKPVDRFREMFKGRIVKAK